TLVHEEACRWEHVMSESVERRIIEMLEHPTHSPYGNPIPGLDEFGDHSAGKFSDGVVNIVNFTLGAVGPIIGVIRRLGEPVQY
ncbi:iron dependent repressor, metal binding and dimerization domain protein, partial [Pseudomonas sp. CCI2.4]|uniref:metal-dependent transcriptional regulator n=1 Tax=Pseudomonas sp. CCI2.4 TaxID=3048617 RepID=UPI002B224E50